MGHGLARIPRVRCDTRFGVAPSTVIPGGKAIECCSGLRLSTRAGQVAGRVIHEPAPALEQVRAAAGGVDPAADLVRQRCLRRLARMIRRPKSPVKECIGLYLYRVERFTVAP